MTKREKSDYKLGGSKRVNVEEEREWPLHCHSSNREVPSPHYFRLAFRRRTTIPEETLKVFFSLLSFSCRRRRRTPSPRSQFSGRLRKLTCCLLVLRETTQVRRSSSSYSSNGVPGGRPGSQPTAMAILFAVVARGSTILAKHAWCGGNFLEVTEQILAKIPSENNKLTYSHGNYLFHYICQDRIIYLCITDDDFERSRAFTFLNEIKKRFQTTYGSRAQTALPYAMNSEFSSVLAAQLKFHSENKGPDQVVETQAQVDELKGIMVRNIDLVAQRGEKLELLIDKTENLVDSSVTFKTTSRNLARAMCMKNLKLTIIIAIVSIIP
ncbi:vesicle-associated membrane protein 7 isoform X2 [Rhineura floridana]|uniref:vesicle-associated membrane protein 7 isoform X2 n=1 Tax=Rhineura floridana TaxID=261503 RepID=UPI002AC7F7DB|nr:vesicle-associated membrane protein 7 isoform X2 [Rhineura floridana]